MVCGLCDSYLEPCGCGGQDAGGLARRAALITELRTQHADLVLIDAGRLGMVEDRLPVIARALAAIGADAVGMGAEDLALFGPLTAAGHEAGLPFCSLVPPLDSNAQPVPRSRLITRGGVRLGVVSVAFGSLGGRQLAEVYRAELEQLAAVGCSWTVLISHFGQQSTERLLEAVPEELRPAIVALATSEDEPAPVFRHLGAVWVPLAHKGRSLAVVTATPAGDDWTFDVEQRLITDGPRDERVQTWVDECFAAQRAGEAAVAVPAKPSFAQPTDCVPCHDGAVTAWRQHAHAGAVETLEQIDRDLADCLRCHSERIRREGLRPAPDGDRGIQCATCHQQLENHLEDPEKTKPTSMDQAGCEECHTRENSPQWDWPSYRDHVVATCQGKPQPRLHPAGR